MDMSEFDLTPIARAPKLEPGEDYHGNKPQVVKQAVASNPDLQMSSQDVSAWIRDNPSGWPGPSVTITTRTVSTILMHLHSKGEVRRVRVEGSERNRCRYRYFV